MDPGPYDKATHFMFTWKGILLRNLTENRKALTASLIKDLRIENHGCFCLSNPTVKVLFYEIIKCHQLSQM